MSKPVALIVTGDRNANELRWSRTITAVLRGIDGGRGAHPPTLIHGDCLGVDRLCHDVAVTARDRWNILPMPYINALGKAGGPSRNRAMADVGRALQAVGYEVLCIAFHDDLEHSKGTKHMVEVAKLVNLPVQLCTSDGKVRDL